MMSVAMAISMPGRCASAVLEDWIRTRCTSQRQVPPERGRLRVLHLCPAGHEHPRGAGAAADTAGKDVHVAVIRGGLRAWTKAGLPLEAVPREEMEALPVFE